VEDPKIFTFTLSIDEDMVIVVGDYRPPADRKKKREAFVAVHTLGPSFEQLHTLTFPDQDKNFITICKDPDSGTLFLCENGPGVVVLRLTDENLHIVQAIKSVHSDPPVHSMVRANRLYTCTTQGLAALEFP